MRATAVLLLAAAALAAADQWPQFRGPQSAGIAPGNSNPPEKWSATENVAWKTDIPGAGWSSPVVWGDRIFLTSVISSADKEPPKKGLYFGGERPIPKDEHRWLVYCIDFKTGKILWEREVNRAVPAQSRHLKNTYASETPAVDAERVYFYFGNVGLFVFDHGGKPVWSKRFDAANTMNGWGTAASPIVYQNRIYVVNDNESKSWLAAFDKKTGAEIWKVDRDEGSNWSTPYIWENGQRAELITTGRKRVRSYDLDGKLLWEFGGMSSLVIPTPFSSEGLLFVTSGYVGDQNRPVYVVKPGARGDITLAKGQTSSDHIAWYMPQAGPYNPTPLVYNGIYYTLLDRGFLTAHEARTGKEVYGKQRIDAAAGAFTASPWAYNGKLFLLSEDGDTYVVQAGRDYKLLGKNTLDEMCMATPAIAGNSLIIRTASRLYRIGK